MTPGCPFKEDTLIGANRPWGFASFPLHLSRVQSNSSFKGSQSEALEAILILAGTVTLHKELGRK